MEKSILQKNTDEERHKMEIGNSISEAEAGLVSQSSLPCMQSEDTNSQPEINVKSEVNHSFHVKEEDVSNEQVYGNNTCRDQSLQDKTVSTSLVKSKLLELIKKRVGVDSLHQRQSFALIKDHTVQRPVIQSKKMSRITDRLMLRVLSASSKTESGSDSDVCWGSLQTVNSNNSTESSRTVPEGGGDENGTGSSRDLASCLDQSLKNSTLSSAVKDEDAGDSPTGKEQHACNLCQESFSSLTCLNTHKQTHGGKHRSYDHTKSIRRKGFTPRNRLKQDNSMTSEEGAHSSKTAGEGALSVTRKRAKRVSKTQTDDLPFICSICGKCFRLPCFLRQHRKTHLGLKPHHCDICSKDFAQLSQLKEHIQSHSGEKPYTCDTCHKNFTLKSSLKRHSLLHSTDRPFKCVMCGKSYTSLSKLVNHEKTHSETLSKKANHHLCKTCGKRFPYKWKLKMHSYIHTGERPHICSVCGAGFVERQKLKIHQTLHTGEQRFVCDVCGKRFTQQVGLLTHSLTHTGERPYACDTCGKAFTNPSTLSTHKRTHTGEKPFICAICGRGFGKKSSLKTHILSHTGEKPFLCDVCGKSYNQLYILKLHERIHTGEKPYTCDLCGRGFTKPAGLRSHRQSHTGEKPYTCNICGTSYTRPYPLKVHFKKCQASSPKSGPCTSSSTDAAKS